MPQLVMAGAGIPVIGQEEAPVSFLQGPEELRTLGFRSLDGNDLLPWTGSEWIQAPGITGLDLPPRTLVTETMPGLDGEILREVRIGAREVFLPLRMTADDYDPLTYFSMRDRIAAMLNHYTVDYFDNDGTFELVATNPVRSTIRSLRVAYQSGWEGQLGNSGSAYWESFGLTLRAVQPYWAGEEWSTQDFRLPVGKSWFGPYPGYLGASAVLGQAVPVTVTGDVPSWPVIDVFGPCSAVTLTFSGCSISVPSGLGSGEQMHLITDPRSRDVTFNGVQDWSRIGPSDQYRPMQPGDASITVSVPSATMATRARVHGTSLWQRAW